MDSAFKSKRAFPGFSLSELKAKVASVDDETLRARIVAEIAARESGTSRPLIVPQTSGGTPIFRVGRM